MRALSQASHCAIHLECSKAFHGARACWTFDSTGYSTSGGYLPTPLLRVFVLCFEIFSKLDFFRRLIGKVIYKYTFKSRMRGWRDGSVVQGSGCFSRGLGNELPASTW